MLQVVLDRRRLKDADASAAQAQAEVIDHPRERIVIVRLPRISATAFWGAIRASNQWADAQARKINGKARLVSHADTNQTALGVVIRRYSY
jgi:hypothetical protein